MIVISSNFDVLANKLNKIARKINNNPALWATISQKMHGFIANDHFRKEKSDDGSKWPRRKEGGNWALLRKSGRMRVSIYPKSTKNSAELVSPTYYSVFHHTGTRKMPKRRFVYVDSKERIEIVRYILQEMFR